MFNFLKKYLLIAIFLGLVPSVYAMENSQKYCWPVSAVTSLWSNLPSIPSTLGRWKIRKEAEAEKPKNTNLEFPMANANNKILQILQTDLDNGWSLNVKQNWKKIEAYLLQKIDLNLIIDTEKISLLLLVALAHEKPDINLIKILIKQGADVNKYRFNNNTLQQINTNWARNSGYTALAQAIDRSSFTQDFQIIQELCNAGASITNINNFGETAFHRMVTVGLPKEAFEIVLTNAYPKKINQKEADLQNEGEYLSCVKNHIEWLKEILQMPGRYKKTAAQTLSETFPKTQAYKNEILPLLDGTQLDKDYNVLKQNPHLLSATDLAENPETRQNLVFKIYNNIVTQLPSSNSQKQQNIRIPSGGLEEIFKKANDELVSIVETAVRSGKFEIDDIEKIIILLQNGADLNLKIKDKTLFHLAALYQNEKLFNYLQNQKADGTLLDKNGNTPFDIKNANAELVNTVKNLHRITLENFFNHNKTNKEKARKQEAYNKIIKCIEDGANPDFIKIEGEPTSLLHLAIGHGQEALVDCLLIHGANPEIYERKDKYFNKPITPLDKLSHTFWSYKEIDKTQMKIFEHLLHSIADTDNFSMKDSYLATAVRSGRSKLTSLLISYNANVNMLVGRNRESTILEEAIKNDTVVKEFCDAGAQIINPNKNRTALHYMASNCTPKEIIETVLTCAYPKVQKDKKEKILKIVARTIWIFKNVQDPIFSQFPPEIKWKILLFTLPQKYFYNSKGMLYKAIYPKNYQNLYVSDKTKYRVEWLLEISDRQNNHKKTASQLLVENTNLCDDCKKEVKALFDGTQITTDYNALIENPKLLNPDYLEQNPEIKKEAEKNLAWQIYNDLSTQKWKELGID